MATPKSDSVAICFTQGHKEKLVIEQVQHEGLVDMLFRSGYRLGKIETYVSWQKLCDYQVLVIGAPQEGGKLEETEVKAIVEFVNSGGSLFLIADEGGDAKAKSNLNDVAKEFGFVFTPSMLLDDVDFAEKNEYIRAVTGARHFITREVAQIVFASGCSIELKDDSLTILAKTGPNAKRKLWVDEKWSESEPAASNPVMVVKRHGQGKVIGCGNFSIVTSISKTYGLFAADNFTLVGNVFAWLSNKKAEDVSSKSDVVHLNIAVEEDLFYWMEGEVKDKQRFDSVNALVGFALNAVKQSLDALETGDNDESVEGDATETADGVMESGDQGNAPEDAIPTDQVKSITSTLEAVPAKRATVPSSKPELASSTDATRKPGAPKPRVQTPGQRSSQDMGQKSQGKRPSGKPYKQPDRNLVFKAKPETIQAMVNESKKNAKNAPAVQETAVPGAAIKKQKPGEQQPAKPAEKNKK